MRAREPVLGRAWVRALTVLLVLIIGSALALSVDLPSVGALRSWLDEGGPARWLLLVLGLALALLTPVSRTALSVLVGAVAGFLPGLAVALVGGVLGGLAGFGLSRWLGRGAVTRLAGARLSRVDQMVSERGFASVLAARLMPVAPFVIVSYTAGLSGVRPVPYLLGTVVGLIPWSVLYVGIGAAAVDLGSWTTVPDLALPAVAAVAVTVAGAAWWWRHRPRKPATPQPTGAGAGAVAPGA